MKAAAILGSVFLHLAFVGSVVLLSSMPHRFEVKPSTLFISEVIFQDSEIRPVRAVQLRAPLRPVPPPAAEAKVPAEPASRPSSPESAAAEPVPAPPDTDLPTSAPPVVPPSVVSIQKPSYPVRLRVLGVEGVVSLEVTVSADGRCERAVVTRSSGYSEMDSRALDAVRKASYSPQTVNSVPRVSTLKLTVRFALE